MNLAPCPGCLHVWLPEGNKSPGMRAVGDAPAAAGGWPTQAAGDAIHRAESTGKSLGKAAATAGKMCAPTGAAQELTPQKPQMPLVLPAIADGVESEGVLKACQRRSAQEGPEFYL